MPCRMERNGDIANPPRLTEFDAFDHSVLTHALSHHPNTGRSGQISPHAVARVVAVTMRHQGTIHLAPGIDIEASCFAEQPILGWTN